jgi:hypothetical protein
LRYFTPITRLHQLHHIVEENADQLVAWHHTWAGGSIWRVTVELLVLASKTLPLSQGGCPNTTSLTTSGTIALEAIL